MFKLPNLPRADVHMLKPHLLLENWNVSDAGGVRCWGCQVLGAPGYQGSPDTFQSETPSLYGHFQAPFVELLLGRLVTARLTQSL